MKLKVTYLLALFLVFALSCGNKSKKQDDLVTDTGPFPRYLVNIPAETPYAFGALEPMPAVMFDTMRRKFGPLYNQYRKMVPPVSGNESPELMLVQAFIEEVFDKMMNSEDGMASLGLSKSPTFVVYGLGFFPVIRISLDDKAKMEKVIRTVEERGAVKRNDENLEGAEFWSYNIDNSLLVMSFVNDDLVIGVTPSASAPAFVPYMVGVKKPAKSFADANVLEQIQAEYGFKKFGIGYVDVEQIVAMFSGTSGGVNEEMMKADSNVQFDMDPVCVDELHALVVQAPRAVIGFERLDERQMTIRGGVEVKNGLGADLAKTKTSLPLVNSAMTSSAMVSFGFGFDVGQVIGILRDRMDSVRRQPFQCQQMQEFNYFADKAVPAVQMIPPAVTTIKGGVAAMTGFEIVKTEANPQDPNSFPRTDPFVDGIVAIRTDDPRGLFDLLSAFVPELAAVQVKDDASPTAFQLPPNAELVRQPSVMLNKQLLAMTSGSSSSAEASAEITKAKDNAESPFASFTYDLDAILAALKKSSPDPSLQSMLNGLMTGKMNVELIPEARGIFFVLDQPLGE